MDTQSTLSKVNPDSVQVGELIVEFKRCGAQGDHFGRIQSTEDTRLSRWVGQSEDGKKHAASMPDGKEVFPWEGASDMRNHTSDGAVNEISALLYMSFWNSVMKLAGSSPDDVDDSATATSYLDWMVHYELHRQLDTEVELSAQYFNAHGSVGLGVWWEREVGRKIVRVKLEDLMAMSQAAQQAVQQGAQGPEAELAQVLAVFPQLLADPTLQSSAVDAIKYIYDAYVRRSIAQDDELQESDVMLLSDKRAKEAIRDLREDGDAEFPMPYLCKNQPMIRALKPYRDFIMPTEAGEVQNSPIVFVRQLMTEVDLRERVLSDEWDSEWVEEAIKTKGKFSTWELNNPYQPSGTWSWRSVDGRSWYIETVWAYRKQVDEDGVTQIVYTVFNPHVTRNAQGDELAGKHGILNNPRAEYPIIVGRRERFDRSWLASRGLPEILSTYQSVEKNMIDSVVDLASISVVPPLNVPKGISTRYKIGPAVQNEYVPGREAKFMDMPTRGVPVATEVMREVQRKVARYAGLFHPEVPGQLSAILQQPLVKKFLIMWGEALQMAYEMTVKFAPEKVERVTGTRPSGDSDFHYVMHFDSTQFQPELMEAKLQAFSNLIPEDSEGVIDKTQLIALKARMIDPAMAKELVMQKGPASVRILKDVMGDILNMFAGSEPVYADASNDAAAPTKMKNAQSILQGNPNYMSSLAPEVLAEIFGPQMAQQAAQQAAQTGQQPNPRFSVLVQNYFKNLQQGVAQQQNKMVGRTGVKQLA
jgi:hypothetical protein